MRRSDDGLKLKGDLSSNWETISGLVCRKIVGLIDPAMTTDDDHVLL